MNLQLAAELRVHVITLCKLMKLHIAHVRYPRAISRYPLLVDPTGAGSRMEVIQTDSAITPCQLSH